MHVLLDPDGGDFNHRISTGDQTFAGLSEVHARAFFYLREQATAAGNLMFLFHRDRAGNRYPGMGLGVSGGRVQLTNTEQFVSVPSKVPFPANEWVCLELAVLLNDAQVTGVRAWINDVEITDFPDSGTLPERPRRLNVGFEGPPTSKSADIYIDEVVESSSFIGCTN